MAYEAFLSQDEVDALLAGVTGESDSKKTAGASDGARAYDLSSRTGSCVVACRRWS